MEGTIKNKKSVYISTIAFSLLGILTIVGTQLKSNSILYYTLFGVSIVMLIVGIVGTLGFLNRNQIKIIFYPSVITGALALIYILYMFFK